MKDNLKNNPQDGGERRNDSKAALLLQERKKIIFNLILLGSAAVVVAIGVLTMAWFANNSKVNGTNMSVTTKGLFFDVGTYGANIRYEDEFDSVMSDYGTGTAETISGREYYATGGSTGNIKLRYSTGTSEIGPDGSGELSLYIIPRVDEGIDVRVSLNVIAYAEIDKYTTRTDEVTGETIYDPVYKTHEENGEIVFDEDDLGNKIADTILIEITNETDFIAQVREVNNQLAITNAAEYAAAARYLKGHILFFGEEGDTSNQTISSRYYYKTPYVNREIEKSIASGNNGKAIQIPVYWMWANTLGQLALPNNISGKRSGYPILADSDEDRSDIITYLTNNRADIFANNGDSTVSNITAVATEVATKDDFNVSALSAFNNLSTGYNEADRLIGTRIAYFVIEVTVDMAN